MDDDKLIHFMASAFIAIGISIGFDNPFYGFVGSVLIGIIKEFYDMWKFYKFDIGFGFDIYDIMSDTLGALLGAFIYILFNLATLFS